MKVSVILPTYNEKGNIIALIDAISEQLMPINMEREIIVVDDNSPDDTGKLAQEHFAQNDEVKVFIRTDDKGLATAIRYGLEQSSGDIIIVMDTDFSHSPKVLPQMIRFLEYYDIIIGSRYTIGGGMSSNFRYYGSFIFNFLVRIILNTRIQDNLSGFFCIRREVLFSLDFNRIFWGYGDYFFRLLFYARQIPATVLAVPVVYDKRTSGESKTNLLSGLMRYTTALIKLRFAA